MNYRGLIESGLTLAELNAEQVAYTPETWIRYTTIAAQFGDAVADQMYALAGSPAKQQAFIHPGFDVSSPVTRAAMDAIATDKPEAAPVIAWCLEQGRTVTRPCQQFGYATVSEADLAEAQRRIEMDDALAALTLRHQQEAEAFYVAREPYIAGTGEKPVVG